MVVTFDALSGSEFSGTVSHIDPSAVTSDGVVNYKIKVLLAEKNPNIRSGMNAEISITVKNKENTLSIPKAAIYEKEGTSFVKIVTDPKRGKLKEVAITKGELGDGNMVEIVSGLNKEKTVAIVETR